MLTPPRSSRAQQHADLRKIVRGNLLQTLFQPIVVMSDVTIHGHEALTRQNSSPSFDGSEALFHFAEETKSLAALERLSRENAIRAAGERNLTGKLFVNSSGAALEHHSFDVQQLADVVLTAGLKPEQVVIEITERLAIGNWDKLKKTLKQLRCEGFSIGLDDIGSGYNSLRAIVEVCPEYIKFDMHLIRRVQSDAIKAGLLEMLAKLAEKLGIMVIAEGIEMHEEYRALREIGVSLGQGYFFGRPLPSPVYEPNLSL